MKTRAKPRYLLDINVVLDYLQQREPWYPMAKALFLAKRQEKVDLFIAANSVATLYYLIRKQDTRKKSHAKIGMLLDRLRLADVTGSVVTRALGLGLDDLEDGLQAAAAMEAAIPVLVTRDPKDFGRMENLQVLSPEIAAAALEVSRGR